MSGVTGPKTTRATGIAVGSSPWLGSRGRRIGRDNESAQVIPQQEEDVVPGIYACPGPVF
jgi:hypothetical protein